MPVLSSAFTPNDAPRAGSAEAKCPAHAPGTAPFDAPRAGSAEAKVPPLGRYILIHDAPRAGSAEAKSSFLPAYCRAGGCTPCRQRRGKVSRAVGHQAAHGMHPVQAAPRQRIMPTTGCRRWWMHPVQAAPRQSWIKEQIEAIPEDAPRAGSAEAKALMILSRSRRLSMHPVQAAPRQSIAL